MRVKYKSLQWVLWLVIASFVAWIFLAWGMGTGGGTVGPEGVLAGVAVDIDGRHVSRIDFIRQLRDTENRLRAQLGEQADSFLRQLNLREQVANQLVAREIGLRQAARAGLRVSGDELREHILKTFVNDKGEFVGVERLERQARRAGYTAAQFRDLIADELILERFETLVGAGAVVTDAELKREYLRRNDRAKADYVWLDGRTLGRDRTPTEAQLAEFFAANRDRFAREERRSRHVVFASADYTGHVVPSDDELRAEYEQMGKFRQNEEKRRARHILLKADAAMDAAARQAVAARAQALLERVRAGEDFAALAREHSQDEGSAAKGGDLGSFGRGQMVKPFEDAVFALKPGELAGPVESQFGFHIIQLDAIEPARTFEEARAEIEARVRARKAAELARAAALEAIRKHSPSGSLEDVARDAGKPIQESGFLAEDARGVEVPGVETAYVPSFAQALFRVAETGRLAPEPAPVGSGFAVIELAEKRGPVVPELAAVRARVEAEWKLDQGKALASKQAAEIAAALASGTTLEEAARAQGVEVKAASPFARDAAIPGVPRSEPAAAAAWAQEPGKVSPPIVLEGGVILVRTTEVFRFDEASFEAGKEALRAELERSRADAIRSALVRSTRKELEAAGRLRWLAADLLAAPEDAGDAGF